MHPAKQNCNSEIVSTQNTNNYRFAADVVSSGCCCCYYFLCTLLASYLSFLTVLDWCIFIMHLHLHPAHHRKHHHCQTPHVGDHLEAHWNEFGCVLPAPRGTMLCLPWQSVLQLSDLQHWWSSSCELRSSLVCKTKKVLLLLRVIDGCPNKTHIGKQLVASSKHHPAPIYITRFRYNNQHYFKCAGIIK